MMKKSVFVLMMIWFAFSSEGAEIESLSDVFNLGKGILDQDKDGFADKVALCIVIPDEPSACEIAAASDIAARANFDSLVVDFSLVKKESELNKIPSSIYPILLGSNLDAVKKWSAQEKLSLDKLDKDQGIVALFSDNLHSGLVVVAGSDEALLHTAREFFLRWPYLWEIWGREEGDTYLSLEEDLHTFFEFQQLPCSQIEIVKACYRFPTLKSPHDAIKKLRFDRGEIKDLSVAIDFVHPEAQTQAIKTLEELKHDHKRGIRTDTLSFPGCAKITFELRSNGKASTLSLPRMGHPKRMLTPSYKPRFRPGKSGKEFDLTNLFTAKGFYSDADRDNILDTLDSVVILPQNTPSPGAHWLTSRLALNTAGISFPMAYLDKEIENKQTLKAPILIGKDNHWSRELQDAGKLKKSPMEKGWGKVQIVPQALNKSSAMVILEEDALGLQKTLFFIGRTFPYFSEFGEGHAKVQDVPVALEEFLEGKRGSAEAHFWISLQTYVKDLEDKKFDHFNLRVFLPEENKKFMQHVHEFLDETLDVKKIDIQEFALRDSKNIFQKEKEFSWEGDDAIQLIQEDVKKWQVSDSPIGISVGVSESPDVRKRIKQKVEDLLRASGFPRYDVDVSCSYKQGFFWIIEKVLPRLWDKNVHHVLIRFAPETEDFSQPKRFYSESYRWLQELYPVDELIAEKIKIPLDMITFEMKDTEEPIYDFLAYDQSDKILFQDHFSPHIKEAVYMKSLPEWGKVKLTTGWIRIERDRREVLDTGLTSDLEKFWEFYQEEILKEVYSHILKKTGNHPTLQKQPYFKRMLIEMWFSEPDFKIGLDEEIVSSLEAIHDEIYFDTLDFFRGITEIELEQDDEIPEDTSRLSAPGNILPKIYPSSEGKKGKAKITFDDWQARSPEMVLEWKEEERRKKDKKFTFPNLKAKSLQVPSFIYNGMEERIEKLTAELEFEKEKDYLTLLEIIDAYKELQSDGVVDQPFGFPNLHSLAVISKHKDWEKEEIFLLEPLSTKEKTNSAKSFPDEVSIPTEEIISPQMCLDLVEQLDRFESVRTYIGGKSYENRKIPVLEVFTPLEKYISIPRLISRKPTLYLSGRQHANEVSATNYILKFAELLAEDPVYREYIKNINFILHPMENPDGAELAYDLQKITPFHSLHAGRYTSLGIDVGYQVGASKPILPEARVRKNLYDKWLPDIYLNLHGYPSHEWVQQFSNYIPYQFRDYWIPRGWFAYYRALSLPLYEKWAKAGEELRNSITQEINANTKFKESNRKFYDRYYRWAARWQPHMNYLENHDGVNLYAKRRSSRESKLSNRRRITFVEETPELMDETAQEKWLDFLVTQGLTYLRAHAKYLSQAQYETVRIEEEGQDRVHIQLVRSRPGKIQKNN
ncbi:MAG: hypothetical protein JSV17_16190 [Candidatus Aminicenantes bacterium]|nr:MAG: hypothetical protein JSV17_16190 [Candidatus Aminicenantes bacterium]